MKARVCFRIELAPSSLPVTSARRSVTVAPSGTSTCWTFRRSISPMMP
jgi:hypothetical protein